MNVGDKIKGFKFTEEEYPTIGYVEEMEKYVGKEGKIEDIDYDYNIVEVVFDDNQFWNYPLELAKDFLIKNK